MQKKRNKSATNIFYVDFLLKIDVKKNVRTSKKYQQRAFSKLFACRAKTEYERVANRILLRKPAHEITHAQANKVVAHNYRYGSKRAAKQHITQIIETLNQKLSGGWSPFFEGEDSRLYENLPSVCNKFIAEKEKILRKNTLRSYVSVTKQLILWANENYPNIYFTAI